MLSTHLIADVLRVLMLVSCTGCSSQLEAFPRRACVFDSAGRYRAGMVIAKRDDDAVLFQFNDRYEGDHGFLWVAKDDPGKHIRPCMDPSNLTDAANQKPIWEHR